jgi:hypothetical protein
LENECLMLDATPDKSQGKQDGSAHRRLLRYPETTANE